MSGTLSAAASVPVWMHVDVCVIERGGEREGGREGEGGIEGERTCRDRQTHRQRDRETDRLTDLQAQEAEEALILARRLGIQHERLAQCARVLCTQFGRRALLRPRAHLSGTPCLEQVQHLRVCFRVCLCACICA